MRIRRHRRNEGLENYIENNCKDEFSFLMQIIDDNQEHYDYLDNPNNLMRYNDIRTYKYNRVNLTSGHKYINASWIHIPTRRKFIATQGPLPQTIEDFWIMCDYYDVEKIVMLCKLEENKVPKCAKYWDAKNMNYYEIHTVDKQAIDSGLDLRVFQLINYYKKNTTKTIYQMHLTCWDDHTALNHQYFGKIIQLINFIDQNKTDKPIVVHCSAGVGRTGTFISLYNLYHEILQQINTINKEFIEFSVFNLVRKIKELRMFMVENVNQYKLLYSFVDYLLLTHNI